MYNLYLYVGYYPLKINLIAVGKLKEKYWNDAINEYRKRLSRFCNFEIIEIQEGKNLEIEAEYITKKIKGTTYIFDIDGEMISSNELAEDIQKKLNMGSNEFSFVIGSSYGLSEEIKAKGKRISFGRVTYPHQLMRVIATEQIYRSMTINNNITYHK